MANDTQIRRTPAKKAAAAKTTAKAAPAKAARPAPKKAAPKKAAAKAPAATKPAAAPPLPPAGWYLDPADQTQCRYWDGEGYVGDPISADIDPTGLGPPTGAAPTEPDDQAAAAGPKGEITYRGRTMKVRRPTPEQLMVWKRIAEQGLAVAADEQANPGQLCAECGGEGCDTCHNTGKAHTAKVMKLFDRALRIIASVLVDEADRDWLEDQLLDGTVNLNAAGEIVTLAVNDMIAGREKAAPRTGPTATRRPRRR